MRANRLISVAGVLAMLMASVPNAQPVADDNGPAEMPPVDYFASQYVDSRGCAYVRAEYVGDVIWIPRVNRARELSCGFEPTFAAQVAVAAPVQPAPKIATTAVPDPKSATGSMASAPRPASKPLAKAKKRVAPKVVPPQQGKMRLPENVCGGRPVLSAKYIEGGKKIEVRCGTGRAVPPTKGTASKSYVQVGTFGVASNAQATIAQLRGMGLPVAVATATFKGKPVQVVLAGPFAQQDNLDAALGAVRNAGFGDAFLRK